nr:phosphatidylglycerophosphatase A [Paenibacillus taiwanensis]
MEGAPVTYDAAAQWLEQRGVSLLSIAEIAFELQKPYNATLKVEDCLESVKAVLHKREVQYTLMTGIALDVMAERKQLPEPLQSMLEADESLYGVDETLALGITGVYGTIGLTSFGYLDKTKIGVLRHLNNHQQQIHVFLDDLVAGIAAAASSRIAHQDTKATIYDTIDRVDS